MDDNQALAKAEAFFEKARGAANASNFDYAIEMYLEGLRCCPDALEAGHMKLHELALLRQSRGGKKPSMMEKVKQFQGKTALDRMLNAEHLFAKDPEHLPYAQTMVKASAAGGYKKTAKWIADLVFQANNAAAKPSLQTYLLLKDAYVAIGLYDRALAACQHAVKLKPEDIDLADELQNLSAELTVARGRYDQEGDFTQSIKDREFQDKLHAQDGVVKTEDYRVLAVEEARKAIAQDPNLPRNIFNLADALSDLEQDDADDEAIAILENTYKSKSDFSFKQRAGLIEIKRFKRRMRQAKNTLETNPEDAEAKSSLAQITAQLNKVELQHYRLCVENYPTDLQAKYQYGIRLLRNKQYDQAIPLFQETQKDPRRKILSMGKVGLCFFMKGWFTDAIDIFNRAIDSYEIKGDALAKELRYNLGCAYEKAGDKEKALDIFRKIAQLDFGYKDVGQRVDNLRGKAD